VNGDPCSIQIKTQHYGAKSQTVRQLMNSGTAPSRQVALVQPLWVIETPTDEVNAYTAPPYDNPNGIMGLH
jgi:hypothetical protein